MLFESFFSQSAFFWCGRFGVEQKRLEKVSFGRFSVLLDRGIRTAALALGPSLTFGATLDAGF